MGSAACWCDSYPLSHRSQCWRHNSYSSIVLRFQSILEEFCCSCSLEYNLVFPRRSCFNYAPFRVVAPWAGVSSATCTFCTQSQSPKTFLIYCCAQGSHAIRDDAFCISAFNQSSARRFVKVTPAGRGFHLYFLCASRRTPGALRVLGYRSTGKVPRVGRARRCNRRVCPLRGSLLVVAFLRVVVVVLLHGI